MIDGISSIKPVFNTDFNNKQNDIIQIKKYKNIYNKQKFIEITPIDIINIFIKYNIPVAKETIDELKKYTYLYMNKER